MQRICPSCKEDLGTLGDYFCYNCGFKLPDELASGEARSQKARVVSPPFVVREEVARIPITLKEVGILLSLAVGTAILVFGLVFLYKTFAPKKSQVVPAGSKVSRAEGLITFKDADLPSERFNEQGLVQTVPFEADFFVEGHSFDKFVSSFVRLSDGGEVPILEVGAPELSNFLDGHFVLFSLEERGTAPPSRKWGFVSRLKEPDLSPDELGKSIGPNLKLLVLDDYVVVTDSEYVEREVREAKKKASLNLSLNSKYAIAANSLPREGKLFILLLTPNARDIVDFGLFNGKFRDLADTLIKADRTSYVVN